MKRAIFALLYSTACGSCGKRLEVGDQALRRPDRTFLCMACAPVERLPDAPIEREPHYMARKPERGRALPGGIPPRPGRRRQTKKRRQIS